MSEIMNVETMQNVMGQLVTVTKSNTEGVATILLDINNMKNTINGLSTIINDHGAKINVLGNDVADLKLNEEITEDQANTIRDAANRRVAEILHRDYDEMAKYFRSFIAQLWRHVKRDGAGAGASYRRTKKRNYQRVLDEVEAWIPNEGIQGLKEKVDKKAEAKRKAKANGYID